MINGKCNYVAGYYVLRLFFVCLRKGDYVPKNELHASVSVIRMGNVLFIIRNCKYKSHN